MPARRTRGNDRRPPAAPAVAPAARRRGRRRGTLSNLHLGAWDPETGQYVMLGKTFKGLTDEMLRWQTEKLISLETSRDRLHVCGERLEHDRGRARHTESGSAARLIRTGLHCLDESTPHRVLAYLLCLGRVGVGRSSPENCPPRAPRVRPPVRAALRVGSRGCPDRTALPPAAALPRSPMPATPRP